jgi:hypothetical protein
LQRFFVADKAKPAARQGRKTQCRYIEGTIMRRKFLVIAVALVMVMGMAGVSSGALVDWANWTSATPGVPGTASGNIGSNMLTYTGEFTFAQLSNIGTYYWTGALKGAPGDISPYISATVENNPPTADLIAQTGGYSGVNTITFSQAVTDPVMAIVSLGRPTQNVTYYFNQPFTILSQGPGWWGGPGTLTQSGNNLIGLEGDGTIQFLGTYTSISWTAPDFEFWYGFTVGVVPLPPTALLLGTGLLGLVGLGWRRARKEG